MRSQKELEVFSDRRSKFKITSTIQFYHSSNVQLKMHGLRTYETSRVALAIIVIKALEAIKQFLLVFSTTQVA